MKGFRRLGDEFARFNRLGRGISVGLPPVVFLFRDDFLTDEAAPLATPRTAEPGPGTWAITDTANTLDIIGSILLANAQSTGLKDPNVVSVETFVRASGLGLFMDFGRVNAGGSNSTNVAPGFGIVASPSDSQITGWRFGASPNVNARRNANQVTNIATFAYGVRNDYWTILRAVGVFYIQDNILVWVDNSLVDSPLTVAIATLTSGRRQFDADTVRLSQLPAPWDTDNGIATQVLAGARSAGDTFTHEADCLIELEVTTLPSAGQQNIDFRKQDSTNYWTCRMTSNGRIRLVETVAGAETDRITSGAATVVSGDRIMVICDDEVIRLYVDNSLIGTYSSASNFKTETAGELRDEGTAGAVSDIISWPRVISGDALTALNRVADA